jgi:tetratricopeptide (TPR) repeat protein
VYNIKDNAHIRLTHPSLAGIARAAFESPSPNRPVANISFALNYFIHKYDVSGYHWINILIHVTTGIFLYLFVKTTLSLPSLRSKYKAQKWIPFITVLIWLVHPIQTQSVTYIVQRMNSMAAMFYVLSLFLYAKARIAEEKGKRRALFGGCIVAGILALGSKEIAATLPFFIFLYEWYFFQDLSWAWLKRHSLPFAGISILIVIVALMYLGVHPIEKILNSYGARDFTLTERVLTQFRVVIFYISLFIFPHPSRLNLDHDFLLSHSLVDPLTTLFSMGAIAGLVGLAIYMAKKERLLSFCILWFLGNLVIESSVIGLEILFEHRTYLPSMLVSLMAVTLAHRYIKAKWWRIGVLCPVLIIFSLWTYERNSVWSDDVTLWKDCLEKSPKKARIHYALGVALADQGHFKEAMTYYSGALKINPDYAEADNNLGVALNQFGRSKEAVNHLSEAIRIKPHSAEVHNNLAVALKRQGKLEDAISHFSKALGINPNYAKAHYNLGVALASQGKHKEAMTHFSEALRIKPGYAEGHNNMGVALASQGRVKEAMSHFFEAVRIKPDYAEAHNNLGLALKQRGSIKDAINHYYEALRIEPHYAEAQYNLGIALRQKGELKEAK